MKIIDITKPITDRRGRPAKLLASGITGKLPGVDAAYIGGETLLIEDADGDVFYIYPQGTYGDDDSYGDDFVNAPERISEFRTVTFGGSKIGLGGMRCTTQKQAQELIYPGSEWDGVLELIQIDDKIVDVKFAAAA